MELEPRLVFGPALLFMAEFEKVVEREVDGVERLEN